MVTTLKIIQLTTGNGMDAHFELEFDGRTVKKLKGVREELWEEHGSEFITLTRVVEHIVDEYLKDHEND